jgi:hypothetical protein
MKEALLVVIALALTASAQVRSGARKLPLNQWQRLVVDPEKPWRAIFIEAADLDGDKLADIVTGGWWYRNPGSATGRWDRKTIGEPLRNMAALHDFDGDGDMDILGTQGRASEANAAFVLAGNDGRGSFTVKNLVAAAGDFLQGIAVARFTPRGPVEAALSWHKAGHGIQMITFPVGGWRKVSDASQDEALSAGDIDRDGRMDLLLGTKWLRNETTGSWSAYTLHPTPGDPDRNVLADVNGDGRLDAVVGFEAINIPGKLAWYEQGRASTTPWTEHVIAQVVGPMSVDVRDMDRDGDLDVVVGEHNYKEPQTARLLVFENVDGRGRSWKQYVVYTGDEHHDGAQVVDIDNDGDLDVVSIGWSHGRVVLYENRSLSR